MRTIKELSQELGLEPDYVKDKLEKRGLKVSQDETLRELAQKHKMRPIEVLVLILEGEPRKDR